MTPELTTIRRMLYARAASVCQIIGCGLGLLVVLPLGLFLSGAMYLGLQLSPSAEGHPTAWLGPVGYIWLLAAPVALWLLLGTIAGTATLQGRRWGRTLSLWLAVPLALVFPAGTVPAVFLWWALRVR